MIAFRIGLRIVGLFVMTLALAQCGDGGGGGDNESDFGSPPPGTFTGTLSDGGSIRLEVGSIESIAFTCDDQSIQENFSPPRPIDTDGTFAVEFTDAGRKFQVRGEFENDDLVQGTIDDQENACDTTFTATRGGPIQSPTRTRTPAVGETPTSTPTPVGSGPTETRTPTPVCTSSCVTPPTDEPSDDPTPHPCPVAVEVVGNSGAKKVLDSGWSGLAHNATVVSDGKLTFAAACPTTTRPCDVCTISGPIANSKPNAGDIDSHRCSNDSSIKCSDNTPCGSGTCVFYFGAPLPLSAGGINTCVSNQVVGAVAGTANVETGVFQTTINLRSSVYNQTNSGDPCPKCNGDGASNDGIAAGTCLGGARNGQSCDVNGTSPIPSFGKTSLDCPPEGLISALSISLDGSSGTETRTLDNSSFACTGVIGANPPPKCFCMAQGSEPTQPNACIDDTSTPDLPCVALAGSPTKGECETFVGDRLCSPAETFRGCTSNDDCTAPGDTCIAQLRPCYLDNGKVGGSVTAKGLADPPDDNGVSNPTFAALFCIPPVAQGAINKAGGLPGLGRIELPLISKEIYVLP